MARRFVFRLETVLRLRRQALEKCQRVVADRLRHIAEEQAVIATCQRRKAEQVAELRTVRSLGVLNVAAVCRHQEHMIHLEQTIVSAEQRIAEHEDHLRKEREELVQASVAVKAIERLKERRYARYLEEVRRAERLEQDELATQLYLRQRAEATRGERFAASSAMAVAER